MNTASDRAPNLQRAQALLAAQQTAWDIVIIGGGITGAGILLEASRRGLKALLVEQRDFAWGTSSRSSKLVHGGLRYLKEGQLRLTRDSVRERQNLLQQAGGLVDLQSFAFADYRGRKPGRWVFQLGLAIYDRLAGRHQQSRGRHYQGADDFLLLAPHIGRTDLKGGLTYLDAKTDDARLVLRVLQEARGLGGVAINYVRAEQLLRAGSASEGTVTGVRMADALTADTYGVTAKVVINATGAWADGLRQQQGARPRLRPLRGSHLVLPAWRLPVAQAVSLMHPQDGRPVFVFPWEGATLVGTTDIDHRADLRQEARITPAEVDYLMAALHFQFPSLQLTRGDVIATYAGVRPVIDTGKADPSQEGRDHAVWLENGLLTVTGGKLTTFRLIALDALAHVVHLFPQANQPMHRLELLAQGNLLPASAGLSTSQRQRLQGHYGPLAASVVGAAQPGELQTIAGTQTLWVELRWAARTEAVVRLEDLLLRRTRLGLLLRGGGAELLPHIRTICQSELGWNDARWQQEALDYMALWQSHYSLPQAAESATGECP
ncbi:MAG: glycerol-3-phosphate dehydrogenase/oxidase [Rhodoferax sp.]